MNVPLGDTSNLTQFIGSAMNRLATMNYRKAVRRCSILFCDALVQESLRLLELVGVYCVWCLLMQI